MSMDDRGFILYEVMLSLIILSIVTSLILPAIIEIQHLRNAASEERKAIRLLAYEIGMPEENTLESDYYRKSEIYKSDGTVFTCLTWPGSKELDHEWCLETIQN